MGSQADEKMKAILRNAVPIFYEIGYDRAAIRDIARISNISPAAIYYYFKNKEELLYHIQKNAFEELIGALPPPSGDPADAEAEIRAFVANHLNYFIQNMAEMKILSHESESLTGAHLNDIRRLKRDYVKRLQTLIEKLDARGRLRDVDPRLAALSLFGMMNWVYTWYHSVDHGIAESESAAGAPELIETMCDIFLRGVLKPGAEPEAGHGA